MMKITKAGSFVNEFLKIIKYFSCMESDKKQGVSKPVVDEDYLMNIMSGDEVNNKNTNKVSS
jgi:hypothetical protein